MTPEQTAAYINSQSAMLNAEIAAMQAENLCRAHSNQTIAYGDAAFQRVIDSYSLALRADCAHNCLVHGEIVR